MSIENKESSSIVNNVTVFDGDKDVKVPARFICPITLTPMVHPIMTRTGFSFERQAILAWLEKNDTCPLTRQPLGHRDLLPNLSLQDEIRSWKLYHGLPLHDDTTMDDDDDDDDDSDDLEYRVYVIVSGKAQKKIVNQYARRRLEHLTTAVDYTSAGPSGRGHDHQQAMVVESRRRRGNASGLFCRFLTTRKA